jgi:hypothetical protein
VTYLQGMTSPLFTCTRSPVNLTPEQAELITEPIEFDRDLKRTYRKDRIEQALRLFGEVFGSSFKNAGESIWRCDDIQGQAFKDGLAMLGYEYGANGATHFAIASDGHGGWTSYHIKTLGGQFTANADFYFASSLTQNWAEALQIIEDKADWGIRGVESDEYDAHVCHDDKSGWNPRGCNRCTSGCRYCAKGIWSKTEPCEGCLTGCRRCMNDYPSDSDDSDDWDDSDNGEN